MTVAAGHNQVDLALPAEVPIALLVPGVVDLIAAHNQGDAPEPVPHVWALSRVGQQRLDPASTLLDHDVRDGDLLLLTAADEAAPPPLFDDVVAAVAVDVGARSWTPIAARRTAAAVALVATAVGASALITDTGDVLGAVAAFAVATLFLAAGITAARIYDDRFAALTLCGCALAPAIAAGVLVVPGSAPWAQALLGTSTGAAAAATGLRFAGEGRRVFTAVIAAAGLLVPIELAGVLTDLSTRTLGAAAATAAMALLAAAPRLAILLAKIPLPPVPTPGRQPDDVDPGPAELAHRAGAARRYLTGLLAASALVATAGALGAIAISAGTDWPTILLALACAATLMFRGRGYAAAEHVIVLLTGGTVILLVGMFMFTPWVSFAAATTLAAAALACGFLAPTRTFTPPLRRAVELAEYACAAAIVPLACWATGLFALIRGL
ncbi:MAG TPA: type VII secretion integral membrane protein EccD [Aldersonia sp.]